jgi:malate synthase
VRHGTQLQDGRTVTRELVRELLDEETAKIRRQVGEKIWEEGHPARTRELFERVALSDELTEFLTLPAYQYLD